MATTKLLLALFLSLLATSAFATSQQTRLTQAQQCRLQRLTASQPSQTIQSEGGVTEIWDQYEDQFQCAGVAPIRNILKPNSLSLPNYHPFPRLVYIEKGQGLIGVNFPGCAETFQAESQQHSEGQEEQQWESRGSRDLHQKVHRFRRGDILAIPAGAVHWTYNDGNEEIIAVSINDLNNPANQLDLKSKAFYLAGGTSREGKQGQQQQQGKLNFQNIFSGFNPELLAEAFSVPVEVVRKMQRSDDRGIIVNVRERMTSIVRPDERQEQGQGGERSNGLEETMCNPKIRYNLDNQREADVFAREAGQLNIVNQHKLPILRSLDLSAEKGTLLPNSLFTPHWSMNGHTVVYITRGDAKMQIVSNNGQALLDDQVNEGDMFVIPQFYASTCRAGRNGLEWVAFKTTKSPMKSPLAGYTSVFRAMPLEVITNAYQISPSQAQNLKASRGSQTYLLSPKRTSS